MDLLIAGNGFMATQFLRYDAGPHRAFHYPTQTRMIKAPHTVGVYLGSQARFGEFLAFCEKRGIPLMQCSSNIESPWTVDTSYIDVPNASCTVIYLMHYIAELNSKFAMHEPWKIIESHQLTKRGGSETARRLAKTLGVVASNLSSIRGATIQLKMGIPESHISAHAMHEVTGELDGVEVSFKFLVKGRKPYVRGMIYLAENIHRRRKSLKPKVYPAIHFLK